ncbi:MAG: SRPBCC domain-containing protein [Proteobacteria bacterium]|nr:SRPBCC domain-containing protein [Pseudomonadota bacterium]
MRHLIPVFALLIGQAAIAGDERIMFKTVDVEAPIDTVWDAWTTEEGLTFISSRSNVELRSGGPYEWFLDLEPDSNGRRGGEGSRVLAWVPLRMLAFSWTFPPDVPELRDAGETTQVVVFFDEVNAGKVRVRLFKHGWQDGEAWRRGWDYFDRAWSIVLERLKAELEARE